MKTPCRIRHEPVTVNNPHYINASDVDLGTQRWEWRTERRCEVCDVLLEVKK